ncbi:MAG: GDSL-type esterase/lipase family protein [Tomitella sp.]|nr:GDSL-type esterase/lipase family protein [Tomitella sp.]
MDGIAEELLAPGPAPREATMPTPMFRYSGTARRLRRTAAAFAAAAGAVMLAVPAAAAPMGPLASPDGDGVAPSADTTDYLSLGDALATGYQPDTGEDEPIAYSDKVFAALHADDPGLQFVQLGCDGETTTTMIDGGKCAYDSASQLDAAVDFIDSHPGQIAYLTNDIGANDIFPCVGGGLTGGDSGAADSGSAGSAMLPMAGCIADALGTIRTNLDTIDARISEAGGDGPVYVGMTYYNPMLAMWAQGGMKQALAAATVPVNNGLSAMITSVNAAHGWATADVTAAFETNDFTGKVEVPGMGTVPTNVARICTWTWMCQLGDIHANETGHQVIADAFLPLLTGESGGAGSLGSAGSIGSVAAGPSGSIGSVGSVRGLGGLGAS